MIELCHLAKSFDNKHVISDVNLEIPDGKKITIIGPSGSGKSTILKLILCLIKPDSGKVVVDGQDLALLNVDTMYNVRKKIGLLFQSAALFDSLSVEENVAFTLLETPHSLTHKEIQNKVDHALDLVEMSGFNGMYPSELSGGQQKRVGLARAIINNPKYLLFDEPTTGLDPVLSTNIENLIVRISDELNTTAIIVTHQISTIMRTSDMIYYLDKGVLCEPETPKTIMNSSNPIIASFISGNAYG